MRVKSHRQAPGDTWVERFRARGPSAVRARGRGGSKNAEAQIASMDNEERAKVRQLIETIIAADRVVTVEETEFLRRVMQRLGLVHAESTEELAMIDAGRTTATLRTLAPDVQSRVMALLVEAAIVDGQVVPEERALLLASAAALGIDACALEERIARRLGSSVAGLPGI